MQSHISKVSADFLRHHISSEFNMSIKATHARELVAASFGYKSHAALLAEKHFPVDNLESADVFVPDVASIESRRLKLNDLPASLPASHLLAKEISTFLSDQGYFPGKVWLYDSLGAYVTDVLLVDEDGLIMDELAGVMAETNASFEDAWYDEPEVIFCDDRVSINVVGTYSGDQDPDRMWCGDTIDMSVEIEMLRIAGHNAFMQPDISAGGQVNHDWADT